MRFSILIPHYCTGKMTSYTVAQLLKYKGHHELDIVVIDNKPDGSIKYLDPYLDEISIVDFPNDRTQSHGAAFDYVVPHLHTEHFITLESDGYPTKENWLDYYENLINHGYDAAGSLLDLSGGTYLHPCGAMYKKSVWEECQKYCDSIPYSYFPNMARKEGFDCHLMVHDSIYNQFMENPEDYVDLADGYKPYNAYKATQRKEYYRSIRNPFHNGMGGRQESESTYGKRTIASDSYFSLLTPKSQKLIFRIGYEPGQYLSYWMEATGKKVFYIQTNVVWVPGREHENQEYTIMENGLKHIWGVSSYRDSDATNNDWIRRKQIAPVELYETLPDHQKI